MYQLCFWRESRYFLNAGNCADIFTVCFSPFMNAASFSGRLILDSTISSTVSLNLAGWAVSRNMPISPGFIYSRNARYATAPCGFKKISCFF